ncbi:RNA polymerase, sigma-24 subunit, ECF subfamily, partial [mine drainage metagenome]
MAPATLETRDEEFARRVAAEINDLYRYAHWLVGNDADAEDVVGDTIVRALERRDQFRDAASLRAWLRQILYHRAIDRARHRAHEVSVAEIEHDWGDERYSVDADAL